MDKFDDIVDKARFQVVVGLNGSVHLVQATSYFYEECGLSIYSQPHGSGKRFGMWRKSAVYETPQVTMRTKRVRKPCGRVTALFPFERR